VQPGSSDPIRGDGALAKEAKVQETDPGQTPETETPDPPTEEDQQDMPGGTPGQMPDGDEQDRGEKATG
jgi:hypothetical protein